MKYIINKSTNPSYNFALEEYFLKETNDSVFMIWQNEPTVLLGRCQNRNLEVNLDYTRKNNINIVRRLSGGGTVYCDLNNMQYSFITKRDDTDNNLFKSFAEPVIWALNNLGLNAEFTGRNDILLDGKKISGNAQYKWKDRIIHHGTLLFDADMNILSNSLKTREIKFIDKNVQSHRSRVGQIKNYTDMNVLEFLNYIAQNIVKFHNITEIREPNTHEEEALKKYLSDFPDLNFVEDEDMFKKYFAKKYPFGLVEYGLVDEQGKIKKLKIMGDFFLNKEIDEFVNSVIGKQITDLKNNMSKNIGDYIDGMTNENFVDDLLQLTRGEENE
ncbi:MAG: lipoate--protein ligase [Ezakiella sp.]|nr:lipoate--protein ligase [Ezakiella sp.]MDD7472410.1 lipoate--protein ligase [Bacillota bacterium]MDY3923144.1 lipoate--protein ligase [Ezakiella sp.]